MNDILRAQNTVGWQAMLQGCTVNGWEEVQQAYLTWLGKKTTGKRWLSALICKLWSIAWDQWEHRNGILHDVESNRRHVALDQHISTLHAQGSAGLDAPERRFFEKYSLPLILSSPPTFRQRWASRIEAGRLRVLRRAVRQSRRAHTLAPQRRILARWLGSTAS